MASRAALRPRAMSEKDKDQLPPKRPRQEDDPPPLPKWPLSVSLPPAFQVLDILLETVFQILDALRDRIAASLVCHSWHRAESATCEAIAVCNILAASAARTVRRFSRARSLLLKGHQCFADFNLLPPGWAASAFCPWAAAVASASFPNLTSLYLKRIPVTDACNRRRSDCI